MHKGHNLMGMVVLLLVAQLVLCCLPFPIPVEVNGRRVDVDSDAMVGEALAAAGIELHRGDLLGLEGRLLREGGGGPPLVLLNGHPAPLSKKVKPYDEISVRNGLDVKETLEERAETIYPPPPQLVGRGAFIDIKSWEEGGLKMRVTGSVSHEIVDERVLRQPMPTILKRVDMPLDGAVALTFDDGPDPRYTPLILSILREKGVPATFFVIGREAGRYPHILQEIVASGCEIGNHSYSHAYLGDASYNRIAEELDGTQQIVLQATGKRCRWFRPPGGDSSPYLFQVALQRGYRIALWNVDPWDWERPKPRSIWRRILRQMRPGAVVVMHDGGGKRDGTLRALPTIIDELRARGYRFVTLDELYESPKQISN